MASPNPFPSTPGKLVAVTAGALATPTILERSGIGRPDVLRAAGITVQVPLMGVGENVRDHVWLAPCYRFTVGCENVHGFLQDTAWYAKEEKEFLENGKGMLASNPMFVNAKLAPRTEEDFAAI
jgi:alcohol oxidase